jgi:hypothetical protein
MLTPRDGVFPGLERGRRLYQGSEAGLHFAFLDSARRRGSPLIRLPQVSLRTASRYPTPGSVRIN